MKIRWTSKAVDDLAGVREYIGRDKPEAAVKFAGRILEAIDALEDNPLLGRSGRAAGTRDLQIGGTPYFIVYRMTNDAIQILRVRHTSTLG